METWVNGELTTHVMCPKCEEVTEFEGNADGKVFECDCGELIRVVT
jgi:hypothetical protein